MSLKNDNSNLVGVRLSERSLEKIDDAVKKGEVRSRAEYIRMVVYKQQGVI